MPASAVATLARAAAGVTGYAKAKMRRETPPTVDVSFRSAPSPGGLYGLDLYVVAQKVRGLKEGLYLYQPRTDKLLLLKHRSLTISSSASAEPPPIPTRRSPTPAPR